MKPVLLTLLLSIYLSPLLQAQCSFTASVITQESRCKESGRITVTVNPAGTYSYQITSGPLTSVPSSSNTFNSLPAGNYVVTVSSGNCSITVPSVVAGSYVEPGLLTATVKRIACPTGSGCITANQPTGGRLPYRYAITAGPVTRPLQNNRDFCGLPAGNYTLQALDSCGVVRTTSYTMTYDTGTFVAYTYGYEMRFANCNDLIICPITGFNNTTSHSQLMVWYVKPNGDTLKVNQLESPVRCDTLVGEAHTYGTWKMLSFDSCGRKYESTFPHNPPATSPEYFGQTCNGFRLRLSNAWKYNLNVGYKVIRCSDNTVLYNVTQAPQTTFYSQYFDLDNSTCYRFEHWNECGDTVRYNYTTPAKPIFNISACEGTGCAVVGKSGIRVWQDYATGTKPTTFKIIDGPEGVGMTEVQTQFSSWVFLRDLALGTYKVEGTDDCGNKDTISITLTKPLIRNTEITQTLNCSGGANVHVKIISNFNSCVYPGTDARNLIFVSATNPNITSTNVATINPSATTMGVWEADFVNVRAGNFFIRTFSNGYGCTWDTTIVINGYTPPVLSNVSGFISASGSGNVTVSLSGGKAPFRYRIKRQATTIWSPWQSNTQFSNVTSGIYDINVEDACPNGSVTSFSFNPWKKSDVGINAPCPVVDSPLILTASPAYVGVSYEWYYGGRLVGTGPRLTIPRWTVSQTGQYILKQIYPQANITDTAVANIISCPVAEQNIFCKNSQVFIPNAFSPDGDGLNDIFMIRGNGVYVKSLVIFNRWGEVVFEKKNFNANDSKFAWDGKVKGVPATPDVFVYTAQILCDNGVPQFYKGNVSVLK
jgi:gliding motility-associated-like protein